MLYPDNFENKIGFDTIRQLLKNLCISDFGREKVNDISFVSDFETVLNRLSETEELMWLLTDGQCDFPFASFVDMRSALQRVRMEGTYLDEKELFDLKNSIDIVRNIIGFIQQCDGERFPLLKKRASDILLLPEIGIEIERILDKFGRIKDNASAELADIRHKMRQMQGSVSKTLQSILRQAQTDGYVDKDVAPTIREGRLVIPVHPMYKRRIRGIIHDESATGKTVFIEPAVVVEANNHIRELECSERREIIKILIQTTDFIRPFIPDILAIQSYLADMDLLRAKALFAIETDSIKPYLKKQCIVKWKAARHPLLFLSLKGQNKDIVPLDILLDNKQRILVISGPNAGGKSVCLKTVALLQYMLQCGLPIPLHESSTAGIFNQLFIDIGDEQSIENDLSTYSSHLLNMKYFLRHATNSTMLLIDEFGTGTEPQIGGAIAESVLNNLNQKQVFGVITTHYTNLKRFATEAEGIANAAMLYDRHDMCPLFQLQIGNPGSSFAIEIARKAGLPEQVIQEASKKIGTELVDLDKYLQDIVRDKLYWENKRQQIRIKERRIEDLLTRYENELSDLNQNRKALIKEAREEAKSLLGTVNSKIEAVVKQIKESQAERESTKQIRRDIEVFKHEILEEKSSGIDKKIENLHKQHKEIKIKLPTDSVYLFVGCAVRIKGQSSIGEILSVEDKMAVVAFGQFKCSVKCSQLERVNRCEVRNQLKLQNKSTRDTEELLRERKLNFKSEIDVRGMRGEEALLAVKYFIDDAMMLNVSTIRILHGTGNGILRQLIRDYLVGVHGIRFADEHVQFGGAGITVVQL